MQIKDFLDGDIESSIIFNLEEISLHKEGPTARIILLYSLPVVWFSLLDVIILQHTYIERMYSSITEAIWTAPSWMRMTIRVAVIAVHVGFY